MSLDTELVVRIVVGTLLGGVIGYERDIHGRPAGLRTHAVVALASATFMVVSTHLAFYQHYTAGDLTEVDGSRIAASVVSGIGFLAGGAILRTGLSIQGLTTAAGLWLVAAIGLCAGAGMYVESVAATVIGIVALTLLRRFEDKDDRRNMRLTLTLSEEAIATDALITRIVDLGLGAQLEGWDKDAANARRQLTMSVKLPRSNGEQILVLALEEQPGIVRMQLDPVV
ncbi:MAG: MgtC/SapB family protein [Kofleriaceae bacterium]